MLLCLLRYANSDGDWRTGRAFTPTFRVYASRGVLDPDLSMTRGFLGPCDVSGVLTILSGLSPVRGNDVRCRYPPPSLRQFGLKRIFRPSSANLLIASFRKRLLYVVLHGRYPETRMKSTIYPKSLAHVNLVPFPSFNLFNLMLAA